MTATILPILTFNERRLTPAFGYVFDRKWLDPQESIVSILWKFARMNGLPGHVVAEQLTKMPIDPYEGIEASRAAVDIQRLHQMLRVPLKLLRVALIPASLHRITSPRFRYCPKCLRRGYHSVVHQLDTVLQCPLHGNWLEAECHRCGHSTPYRLNASLLDAPYRCGNCRQFYAIYGPSFSSRRPLNAHDRGTISRRRLRFYST